MTEPTYYQILQVDPNASPEVIEAAYRRLAKMYHPDVNKSPDAEQKMKQINIAYQVLSNPVRRWQYHGTLRWFNPSASTASDSEPKVQPPGTIHRQTLRKLAWLKYQNRVKDGYLISVGNATDFELTIELLKANVPSRARSYNPTKKEWWISVDYEDVLEALFHNFTRRSYNAYAEPVRTVTYASGHMAGAANVNRGSLVDKKYMNGTQQKPNFGPWFMVILIVGFLLGIILRCSPPPPPTPTPTDITATSTIDPTVTPSPTNTPQPTDTPTPTRTPPITKPPLVPITTSDSRIRQGPGVDYAKVRTVPRGTALDLIGFNDDRGEVWYKLGDGNWIRSDLVANAPDNVPYVAAPSPPKGCAGGCIVYPTWCEPPIKGNVSFEGTDRIYHVPGGEFYNQTEIRPDYGERWFCTEAEAQAAGWRRSKR